MQFKKYTALDRVVVPSIYEAFSVGNKIYYPLIFFPEYNAHTEKGTTFLLYLRVY